EPLARNVRAAQVTAGAEALERPARVRPPHEELVTAKSVCKRQTTRCSEPHGYGTHTVLTAQARRYARCQREFLSWQSEPRRQPLRISQYSIRSREALARPV